MALWSDDEEEDLLVPYGTPLPNEDDLRAMEAAGVSRRKLIQVSAHWNSIILLLKYPWANISF